MGGTDRKRSASRRPASPAKAARRQQYDAAMALVEAHVNARRGRPEPAPALLDGLVESVRARAPALEVDRAWIRRAMDRVTPRARSRDESEWASLFPRYPIDEDGYALAFSTRDHKDIRDTLDRLGVVVVRVFAPATCEASVRAMFEEINAMPFERPRGRGRASSRERAGPRRPIDPDAPETWETANWPSPTKFLIPRPAFHPQAFANRVDAALHELFAALWGDERLRVTIDNWGAVRGTRGLLLPPAGQPAGERTRQDRPRWDAAISPHWDYNPWLWLAERDVGREPGYQGLVALVDQPPGSGCHRTLPGCTQFLETWCSERARPERLGNKRASHRPERDDPIVAWMQELPLRAGDIVIWSWGQLHGSAPNHADRMRLHQYIRMFPAAERDPFYEHHDRYAPARVLAQHADRCSRASLDALGLDLRARRLLGLERWPT